MMDLMRCRPIYEWREEGGYMGGGRKVEWVWQRKEDMMEKDGDERPSITNIQQVVGGSPIDQHLKRPSITNIHPAVEDTEIVLKDQHLNRPSITNIQQFVRGSPIEINI
ncbi:hypothetical protein MRB53_024505 [Persea americana]|uniref:Uncharacterized protein n=1 Tax=Persea americana TaxID=3435 RepID=A0ACC2LCD8_PERAE|nr:hypothetical protein MRB53_024505 [Persea americana]